jgi:hypothetical protein
VVSADWRTFVIVEQRLGQAVEAAAPEVGTQARQAAVGVEFIELAAAAGPSPASSSSPPRWTDGSGIPRRPNRSRNLPAL